MSKAEERALEYYPNIDRKDYPCKELDAAYREVFLLGYRQAEKDLSDKARLSSGWDGFYYGQGYHQAEKDLKLTVNDIKDIDRLLNQCVDCSNPYQEVLKRFNEKRRTRNDKKY